MEYNGVEHEHMHQTLEYALTQLSKREQLLLTLFYQHELNLRDVSLTYSTAYLSAT